MSEFTIDLSDPRAPTILKRRKRRSQRLRHNNNHNNNNYNNKNNNFSDDVSSIHSHNSSSDEQFIPTPYTVTPEDAEIDFKETQDIPENLIWKEPEKNENGKYKIPIKHQKWQQFKPSPSTKTGINMKQIKKHIHELPQYIKPDSEWTTPELYAQGYAAPKQLFMLWLIHTDMLKNIPKCSNYKMTKLKQE
eukprot:407123_1